MSHIMAFHITMKKKFFFPKILDNLPVMQYNVVILLGGRGVRMHEFNKKGSLKLIHELTNTIMSY